MKTLTTLILAALIYSASYGQYNQRWFGIYPSNPLAKLHTFNDGICTIENINPADISFYNTAVGTAIAPGATSSLDPAFNEFRFALTNSTSSTVIVNRGYGLKDANDTQNKLFNSFGRSICEVRSSTQNGGYLGVGYVTSNSNTGATVAGGSDALILKISNVGTLTTRIRVDFSNGADVLNHVIASRFSNDTYYACGTSTTSTGGKLIVMRFRASGNITWAHTYNINVTGTASDNSTATGYALCEDAGGNLLVVGSFHDDDNHSTHGNDALIMKLRSNGNVLFTNVEDLFGNDDQYRMIKQASDGLFLICGSTNSSSDYGMVFRKVPITSSVGVPAFCNKISVAGYDSCMSFDLIERTAASQYFVIGSGTLLTSEKKALVIRTNPAGTLTLGNEYANLNYPESVALDFNETSAFPGISIFANHIDVPGTTNTNAYLAHTYFNGAVCDDDCPLVIATQVHFDVATVGTTNSKSKKTTRKNLAATPINYTSAFICDAASIACGSSLRVSGQASDVDKYPAEELLSLNIFPNPAYNNINLVINADLSQAHIRILNMSGQEIVLAPVPEIKSGESVQVSITELPQGVYILQLISGNQTITKKFFKN